MRDAPLVTVCLPHWQALSLIRPCLRSIRKHTRPGQVHVVVVDNGSRDESLDYLRGPNVSSFRYRVEKGQATKVKSEAFRFEKINDSARTCNIRGRWHGILCSMDEKICK